MNPPNNIHFEWASDRHLLLKVANFQANASNPPLHQLVHHTAQSIRDASIQGLLDVIPAESTVLLSFDANNLNYQRAESSVRHALATSNHNNSPNPGKLVEIPVCYDDPFAPDLQSVATQLNITTNEIVRQHSNTQYAVKFVGFVPGFAYLSGLPKTLEVPRLDSPRPRVPAGSIAIAGNQTAVYPLEVPGGWQLIGRTPLKMFDPTRDPASLLQHGDRVKFIAIDTTEFRRLEQLSKEPK